MRQTVRFLLAALSAAAAGTSQAADLRNGGKLLLTNGITSIEGSSGGGLASWSVIAGNETRDGIGVSAHLTAIALPDYDWHSYGAAIGVRNRVELSYARQNLDTQQLGEALGIGRGYVFSQDVFSAKVRLTGDLVYGPPLKPQIAVGIQHKKSANDALVTAVGADRTEGTDIYLSATKLFLAHSLLLDATVRLTRANQTGLLGHDEDSSVQFEGSAAYQLSRRLAVGGEFRTKPDRLGFAAESDWFDIFAAYAVTDHLTVTAAYVDLGSIATSEPQRGALFQIQTAF
jgi:hypothetical protein|tara:strand:- start:31943 stop:32803 length:861 start_codon:yes stop_codon:yes gene_type:complete